MCAKDICLIEGEVRMTKDLYQNLNANDIDMLLGTYLANFIIASVLKNLATA